MAQLLKGKQIASQTITISGSTGNVIALGDLNMATHGVVTTKTTFANNELVTKTYVDAVAQGLQPHPPVRVVGTTTVGTGTSEPSGTATLDGVSVETNDRVLLINEGGTGTGDANPWNGVWVVNTGGTWIRPADMDGNPSGETAVGDFVFVESGSTRAASGWVLSGTDANDNKNIEVDIEDQVWVQISAPGAYTADGQGIELTNGTTFTLELDGTTLTKSASGLKINDTISTTISSNTNNISSLDTSLSSEISTRTSADTSLSTIISTETSTRTSADTSLSTAISTDISSEVSSRISGDSSLSTALSGETSSRISADTSLNIALSTDISTIGTETDSLSTALSGETSTRISETFSLSTAIATVSGDTLDITTIIGEGEVLGLSGGELTGFTYDIDLSSLSTSISGTDTNVSSLDTALSSESSTRLSSDTSLSSAIALLSSGSTEGVESLSTALSGETSSRISADSSLNTALSSEISTRSSETGSLDTSISGTDANVSSLDTALSSEISTRSSETGSLSTAISNIAAPAYAENNITPANVGATTGVTVSTTAFPALSAGEVVSEESVVVYLNGISYPFEWAQGSPAVFHTDGVEPSTGGATTLYFDGTIAGFTIETDDSVKLKYVISA